MSFSAAVSTIALSHGAPDRELATVRQLGFLGVEIALSRVFLSTHEVSEDQATKFGNRVRAHDLQVVGLHSLFYDRPDLCIFGDNDVRNQTLHFLTRSSEICAAMGGRSLVFGSPTARKRGTMAVDQADELAASFLYDTCLAIDGHGTKLLMEPLGKNESDYLHTLEHAYRLVNQVGRSELGLHFDAKAMVEADEISVETVCHFAPQAIHCHINEMNLGVLQENGPVNHKLFGQCLRDGGYKGWVSLEQRITDPHDFMTPLSKSMSVLSKSYLDQNPV
jgi:sugar phosphate isomerase/epimerase